MGFNFHADLEKVPVSVSNTEPASLSLEERIQKEKDPKYIKEQISAKQKQNSILVQTVLFDKNMKKLLNKIIDETKTKKTFSDKVFYVFFAVFLAVGAVITTGTLVSGLITAMFNFAIVYLIYKWFFKKHVENYYYSSYIKKFKSFFDNKDEFLLSFLDSMLNNSFIGSGLPKDYGISPWDGKWRNALRDLFSYYQADPELTDFLKKNNFNLSKEGQYWELNTLLHKYYADKSDKSLVEFLKYVLPHLEAEMKDSGFKTFDNKQELYHSIASKIGK